jgi:hypothetical protein
LQYYGVVTDQWGPTGGGLQAHYHKRLDLQDIPNEVTKAENMKTEGHPQLENTRQRPWSTSAQDPI